MIQRSHATLRTAILSIIDVFYPLFKKLMPLETFRYAACGGGNTLLDIGLFFVSYNFILNKQHLHIAGLTIGAHIAAFLCSFLVTFPIGFYLSRYVVFQETSVSKRTQLRKYFIVVSGCLFLNYLFLKFFVEIMHWYPTPSKLVTTFFVVIFSYFSQKHFTFKATKESLNNDQ